VVLFYVYLRVTVTNALRYDGNSGPVTIGVGLAPYSPVDTSNALCITTIT